MNSFGSSACRRFAGAHWALMMLFIISLLPLGCSQTVDHEEPILLSADIPLYPPTEIVRTDQGQLLALVAAGESRTISIYQADPAGLAWHLWGTLPQFNKADQIAISAGGNLFAVAAHRNNRFWIAVTELTKADVADTLVTPEFKTTEFVSPQPLKAIGISAGATDQFSPTHIQCAYLTAGDENNDPVLQHIYSTDNGATWSDPIRLGSGQLGRLDLDAQPAGGIAANLVFSRDSLYKWCGLSESDHTREVKIMLKINPDARHEVARFEKWVYVVGESATGQVVGSASKNSGLNWTPAMALAGKSDHSRRPDVDGGFGRIWSLFTEGDSMLIARSTTLPMHPKYWTDDIIVSKTTVSGEPSIAAMPDSSAGVLFATAPGKVFFARVKLPPPTP